ncbi:MAG: membrane protein insertion efficiency factor YidD [Candidatus Moranbacteria bacterium CG_4_10_14_3_um_filter_44_15]|nr:MAG: membrane protein insertion efficiency factor YidD [Candidatus Moranbacteria bacterium CG06_land_8_20_14_3_00_43_56]PIV84151.1 MAG: membrane protein insertion efficiency factor YidD [Candidatus Moranbacteria bacterium CG17_big_fil_post_rev_8_21_14_2_50_44_12]PIW92905.1 MAG: membrane protein insertion efficiency factor YidD [Candidatus Moranbacteria bacterium CG_4_8_14_3_um_filter_43_15]PIX90560.1 MAG: membrane protein insertion efficiency factor YidD [Candidatus Moranbacteria bacterium CG
MKSIILKMIRWYQKYLSLDTGFLSFLYSERICRFHPTCSEYTYQAISKYGILRGGWRGFKRIVRCHPWSKGGNDPLN